jgi:hypothetical protein
MVDRRIGRRGLVPLAALQSCSTAKETCSMARILAASVWVRGIVYVIDGQYGGI